MLYFYQTTTLPPSLTENYNEDFLKNTQDSLLVTAYNVIDKLDLFFLLMAIVGLIFLVASSSVKQGQWKKTGYGLIIGAYGTLLLIKAMPLTMGYLSQVSILNELITIASFLLLFWALINLGMSYTFRLGYNLIEHVEFQRLNKNTFLLSVVVICCVVVISFINH